MCFHYKFFPTDGYYNVSIIFVYIIDPTVISSNCSGKKRERREMEID